MSDLDAAMQAAEELHQHHIDEDEHTCRPDGTTGPLSACGGALWTTIRLAISRLGDCHGLHDAGQPPDFACTRCGRRPPWR